MIKPFLKGLAAWRFLNLLIAVTCLIAVTPGRAVAGQVFARHVPKEGAQLASTGRLPATQQLSLAICLPLRNQAALDTALAQVSDPTSPNYRRYLTPAQFTEQYGPTASDFEAVAAYAEAHGLKVTYRHSNRLILDVAGAVSDIEKTLHVKMMTYKHPKEPRDFYASDVAPSIDLAVPIADIRGLSNYSLPKPNIHPFTAIKGARPNLGSAPNGSSYGGGDFRAAYVPGTSLTGSGQSVALVEFDGYYAKDITAYETQFSLASVALVNEPVDGGVSSPGGADDEVSLDIEMAIAMAPGLSHVYVYEATPISHAHWDDLLNKMATDDLAKQIGCSWYNYNTDPDTTADGIFKQMGMQGQSFFDASGDSDAYSSGTLFCSDNPYITQVGGTTLSTTGPKGTYVSETVWQYNNGSGSSGGVSTNYTIPSWQKPVSMATNQGSTTYRNLPDVALTADNVWINYNNGGSKPVAGTSCAAPLWAGFMALVNQQCVQYGLPTVGFANPAIYAIGLGQTYPNYASSFHDITMGNNFNSNSPSKFSAVAGYDLCTGWGTPAGVGLINALAPPIPLVWVDFSSGSGGTGTYASPYNTMAAGVSGVATGGGIVIRGGGHSTETPTITKAMTIYADSSPTVIGH